MKRLKRVGFIVSGAAVCAFAAGIYIYLQQQNNDAPVPNRSASLQREDVSLQAPDARLKFIKLRNAAQTITLAMPYDEVIELLGEPDADSDWLPHLPTWRLYYFDADRDNRLGRPPQSYISVVIDSETGVKTVNVYDPIFETCNGNKINSTCEPINRKHHDRFAGPFIIGA